MNSLLIAFDENYFESGEVMLYSLSKNSEQSFKIHFFYHEMSDCSLNKLAQIIEKINKKTEKVNQLLLYDVGKSKWNLPTESWTIQMYYRLLAPDYIFEEKVLYLDSDIIVQKSIDEIFEIDMNGMGFVMCEDYSNTSDNKRRLSIPDEYCYCNSGVILMNLTYLREMKFTDLITDWLKRGNQNRLEFPDQDIINGVGYYMTKYADKVLYNSWPEIVTNETKVIHFWGGRKPWRNYAPKWQVWWKYAKECEIEHYHLRYVKHVLRVLYEFLVKIFRSYKDFGFLFRKR